MWACGLPYRISPKSENLRFPPCVLSAKAAVGSRPPHTEQGKNQEKPMAMKYALLQHQGLTCFSWFLSNSRDRADVPGIFVQASAIELAHIAERSRKSQSKFSCKRAQSRTIALSQMSKIEFTRILPWRAIALLRTCSGYAECSRKSRRSGTTPQDMPQTSIPHCISANSCDRTGRHFTH